MSPSQEMFILSRIVVASENDPLRPEFPPKNPKFPATPTYRLAIPGFKNVFLKDESVNPTGTHKDRMAWEIVVTYRDILLARERTGDQSPLPHMSIISSGSAAIAIQTALHEYGLPSLKVLVDKETPKEKVHAMNSLGCDVYFAELGKKPLSWSDILALTKNPGGFDITSSEALDPTTRFYDWMSYEIINQSPDYCFVPFGTGNLYENILNITKREIISTLHDPRFSGDVNVLRKCNFMGATTNRLTSKADKLYSPHLPFVHYDEQWIRLYKTAGYCGQESNVFVVKEKFLNEAIKIANEQSIACEPSGIAGLALFLQMKNGIPPDKKILIINTGKTKYSGGIQ